MVQVGGAVGAAVVGDAVAGAGQQSLPAPTPIGRKPTTPAGQEARFSAQSGHGHSLPVGMHAPPATDMQQKLPVWQVPTQVAGGLVHGSASGTQRSIPAAEQHRWPGPQRPQHTAVAPPDVGESAVQAGTSASALRADARPQRKSAARIA
eukprot:gene9358-2645_t